MTQSSASVEPRLLAEHLPEPPGEWTRTDEAGGIVEYRIAGDDGICAAAKLTIRPDRLGDHAIRLDRKAGCKNAGWSRFDDLERAVETVETELRAAETGE